MSKNAIGQLDNGNEIRENDAYLVTEEYVVVEEIDPLTNELNYSSESLQSFIANETNQMEKKFNDEITAQLIKVWNTVTLNSETQDRQVQCSCDNGLVVLFDVAKIQMDGNCMLGSLVHQIFGYDLNSDDHKVATQKLRSDIVDYINQNYEQFGQHLRGHISDLEECGLDETLGLRKIENIDAKCKYLVNNCMINSGFWASGESLKATCCLHNVNIIVFYEAGPIYCIHKTGELSERTVVIAFRLQYSGSESRNHYDSVCNISASGVYKTAKFISEILSQDSNLPVDLVTSL